MGATSPTSSQIMIINHTHELHARCEAQPMRSASETMIPSGPRT